ncbi:MAG: hypothetical protein ACJ788_23815, partial [Ktedonobacteraceae bacterium]
GMFAVWIDKLGSVVSDTDVYSRVEAAMPTLGDKIWSGSATRISYEQFLQLTVQIGEAPGTNMPQTLPSQTLINAPTMR